jgi:hypothetical protein
MATLRCNQGISRACRAILQALAGFGRGMAAGSGFCRAIRKHRIAVLASISTCAAASNLAG